MLAAKLNEIRGCHPQSVKLLTAQARLRSEPQNIDETEREREKLYDPLKESLTNRDIGYILCKK
jgi:hypothetical protein